MDRVNAVARGRCFGRSVAVTVEAYALSWVVASAIALVTWRRATAPFTPMPAEPHEALELIRYGAPRAPAALLSQALFYTDLFVLAVVLDKGSQFELSAYAAAVRVAQALVLFLTAVSYMFSPFVADLHERGERDRLNALSSSRSRDGPWPAPSRCCCCSPSRPSPC